MALQIVPKNAPLPPPLPFFNNTSISQFYSSLDGPCLPRCVFRVIKFGGDNGPLTPHLGESMSFVDEGVEKGGVLIHCTHGTGRSAAVAIAAAMKAGGKETPSGLGSFHEAFRLVKSRRPGTDPPMPFQQELGEWEKSS